MSAQDNIALLERIHEGFNTGDMAKVSSDFAEDAVWHFPVRSQVGGEYEGVDQILGFFQKVFELSQGNFGIDTITIAANDDYAFQFNRAQGKRNGRSLDILELVVHRVENGKIVESHHRTDAYGIDELFS